MSIEVQKIQWEQKLDLGYPLIDGHHKKLVSLINEFGDLLSEPNEKYKISVGKVLKSLIDYTIYHFAEEEKIMQKYKYANLKEHKNVHENFVNELKSRLIQILQGDMEKGSEFYTFLWNWLFEHIAVTDKKWATHIREKHPDAKIE